MPSQLYLGDCLEILPKIESGSIDVVLCDPPYPEISRPYGKMTEADWHTMMRGVVAESRRILKPSGSAVFILQPNQERLGRMRPWLWEFMAWTCREWNQVQDIWWWNFATIPTAPAIQGRLTRSSLKACVWLGEPDCYRDQESVLWEESKHTTALRLAVRAGKLYHTKRRPSGFSTNDNRCYAASEQRGGVTPFNVLPMTNANSYTSAGSTGHGAGTPHELADWWTRYISPPGGVVCDPFMGSGTMGLAAIARGRSFVGIERDAGYFAIAETRIRAAEQAKAELLFA